jgi:hypothetical protein
MDSDYSSDEDGGVAMVRGVHHNNMQGHMDGVSDSDEDLLRHSHGGAFHPHNDGGSHHMNHNDGQMMWPREGSHGGDGSHGLMMGSGHMVRAQLFMAIIVSFITILFCILDGI